MPSVGQNVLTFIGLFTIISPFVADFNETHVYNPTWTGHAKFHNGQTMSMGVYLGLMTIYFANRKCKDPADSLNTAAISAMAYWVTQLSAILYPGSKAADPPQDPEFFLQGYIVSFSTLVVALGYWLERKRLATVKQD